MESPHIEGAPSPVIEDAAIGSPPADEAGALTEGAIWYRQGGPIWQANRFEGCPSFYPVYRYQDLYSYSPLPLIEHKRVLHLNEEYAGAVHKRGFLYASGTDTIDRDIQRIGGPIACTPEIRDPNELAQSLARALRADAEAVELAHPDHVNGVLCGGRDSLILLLLPWRHPTFALSAPPNYELVRAFVRHHRLPYQVVRLSDATDNETLEREVVENCCRLNLEHCRWGGDLRRISQAHQHKIVFWKGQLADLYLTPSWKKVTNPPMTPAAYPLRAYARLDRLVPAVARVPLAHTLLEPHFHRVMWQRGAMWQGAHLSLLRSLTRAAVLSAYHGPAVHDVLRRVDLCRAVNDDVRPRIGSALFGGDVVWPSTNPGPEPSRQRRGRASVAGFLDQLRRRGVRIVQDARH